MSSPFEVWAPRAESLTLVAAGARYPMTQGEGGWWHASEAPAATGEVSYGYLVDGSETPVPDPRSRRQVTPGSLAPVAALTRRAKSTRSRVATRATRDPARSG